jgi:hypothetical protein
MTTKNLTALRTGVTKADADTLATQKQLADAQAAVSRIQTSGRGNLGTAQAKVTKAQAAVKSAQDVAIKNRDQLKKALDTVIGTQQPVSIAPANVPVALLPVGLETRFSGDTLLVRVIPDQIHVEDHELALTDAEVDAGRSFWRQVWRAGTAEPAATDAERTAWAQLVAVIGKSRRAAWVVDQTAPTDPSRPAQPTADNEALVDPAFPEPTRRPKSWSKAAVAHSLPDRFIAIAYRRNGSGGTATWTEIGRAQGGPVADGIQLGLDPDAPPPKVNDNGPSLPEGMQWIIDTAAAEKAGLLLRVPLPAGTSAVDRLVVFGVLGSLDPAASATRLGNLLSGHHYSAGLELLPVGTPTNNTAADTSGYSGRDNANATFDIERRIPVPPDHSDGALLAGALGISADTLRGVANSNESEQAAAGQLNALVWPAAMGYWLDSLVQPGPSDAVIAQIRIHALQMVRGRGPLPPLRVGKQPYGVLPTTSLSRWQAANEPAGVQQVVRFLRAAYPWWKDGVAHAPVVRANADPDQGVLDALSQLPVSSSVGVRSMIGYNASIIPTPFAAATGAAKSAADEGNRQRSMALTGFKALGVDGFPYLGQLVAQKNAAVPLHLPYVVDTNLPPDQQQTAWQTTISYLNALPTRTTADFAAENPRTLTSVLSMLARRSIMLERVRVGVKQTVGTVSGSLVEAHVRMDSAPLVNAQLISTTATLRIGQTLSAGGGVLAGEIQQNNTKIPMKDYLDRELVTIPITTVTHPDYVDTVNAIHAVTAMKPDRVQLLLGESLDVMSHRFDAWVTSLATRRLADLRSSAPTGVTLGAYGIVEDLVRRPARAPVQSPPEGAPTPLSTDNSAGGYIHAPSLAQAATAAVLRAGHLTHADRDPASAALAIDLSSARVRAAMGLLDGVRQGQSLGALLGYRAERQLHELGAHTAVEVVRMLAPPPVVTATGTPEGIPPRAVCDGLALSRLDRGAVVAAAAANGADANAVTTTLIALTDAVDAVADLLLAESVHQIVRGNPDRAAAALDMLNRGDGITTEPDVVRTPRSGTSLTQRVVIAISKKPKAATGWTATGIRAKAEPRVAAWAGMMLGDPGKLKLTVTTPGVAAPINFTLKDLGVGALDLVFEPLLPRALRYARSKGAGEGAVLDTSAPDVAAMLAMAEMLRDLLTRAREGRGTDLARPQDRGSVIDGPPPVDGSTSTLFKTTMADVDQGDRRARLDAARATLQSARDALPTLAQTDAAPVEKTLTAALDHLASFGIAPGGDPSRVPDTSTLIALRAAASAQLAKSQADPDSAAALFGEAFPVLALSSPPFPDVVKTALKSDPVAAASAEVLAPYGGADDALTSWLERTGRVRPALGRLADILLAARLTSVTASNLRAMQLPVAPFPTADPAHRAQWVGFGFPAPLTAEPVTSVVLHAPYAIDPAAGIALLVIDEYTEVVPEPQTTTGISFGYDAPGARPPQSILLCVPPVLGTPWSADALASVIGETIDLAKIRMVDLSAVAWAGRFVPTLYLTDGDVGSGLDLPIRDIVKAAFAQSMSVHP